MRKLSVAFAPSEFDLYYTEGCISVVIDVLRATSAINAAFEAGAASIIPVATIEEAKALQTKGIRVGAERNGEKIEGFDFGNSPYDYMNGGIKGEAIALTTTNGTQAISVARKSKIVATASFSNVKAVVDWLAPRTEDVVLLCAGWKNRFNLEDSLCAGAIVDAFLEMDCFDEFSDSAQAMRYLYHSAHEDPAKYLRKSSHRMRMKRLNMKRDIKYGLALNTSSIVPILENGKLVPVTNVVLS